MTSSLRALILFTILGAAAAVGATADAKRILNLRWEGDDLHFGIGVKAPSANCRVAGAAKGRTAASCVIARGGGRPATR